MMNLTQCRSFFNKDRYAMETGIVIEAVKENYSLCSLEINESHFNAGGSVQGGAIFTLGDLAFAVASNLKGFLVVSLNNNITFLRAPKGNRLLAEAQLVSQTKRTCCYDIVIKDNLERTVAKMTVTGYVTETVLDYA